MSSYNVLVIGGGIAGLTSAIALRSHGHTVTVLERDPTWSVYGVGIIQQANVVRAAAQLGILDGYLAAGYPFNHVTIFAPNGDKITDIPSPRLAGTDYPANLGVPRPLLHTLLGDRARAAGAEIRLGVTLSGFTDDGAGVDVTFTDGTTGRYDVVIGADGLASETRQRLMPHAPPQRLTGQSVWRYNLPRTPDVTGIHSYEGRLGIGLVPLSETLMYIFLVTAEPGNPWMPRQGIAQKMRDRLQGAPPAIAALIPNITDDDQVVYRPLESVMLDGDWFAGNVILIGDAAHATTPHLGQGAGMAIEDSIVLAEELTHRPTIAAAFRAFMDRRAARCRFIVENSLAAGEFQLGQRKEFSFVAVNRQMNDIVSAPI